MRLGVLFLMLAALPAAAEDVAGAEELRNKASAAWNESDYAKGVELLKEAEALYVGVDPLPRKPWAVTLRMLTWHQMRAGDLDAARATFGRLVETLGEKPGLSGIPNEAMASWRALREAAKKSDKYETGIALYDEAIRAFETVKDTALAAQVMHEAGNFSGQRKKFVQADDYLSRAAEIRKRIEDRLGYTWSSNQLAYWRIEDKRFDAAREPLREAYHTMCTLRQVVPQSYLEGNLRRLLDELAQRKEKKDPAVREWLTEIAMEKSSFPRIVPRTELLRALLAWSDAGEEPMATVKLVFGAAEGLPPEEATDVRIRCADAALRLEQPESAIGWLKEVPAGDAPLARHLGARADTLRALVVPDKNGARARYALAALGAFESLGDGGGLRAAAERFRGVDLGNEVDAAVNRVLRSGAPGGAGGSAMSTALGDLSKMDLHDPLFSLRVVDGQLMVEDLAGEQARSFGLDWKPRNVGFNGMSLTIFGRYVVVRSLSYGRGAAAAGAPGTITLDELGAYRPLRPGFQLQVLRNGALRYARMAEDNKGK